MERDIPLSPIDNEKTLKVWEKSSHRHGRTKRPKVLGLNPTLREESNRRVSEGLRLTFSSSIEDEGVDIYTYFNFYGRIRKSSSRFRRFSRTTFRYILLLVVLSLHVLVPFILLVTQLLSNSDFLPTSDNFWFRFAGAVIMAYSAADLYRQIVNQVNWIVIDNNKILRRINRGSPRPKTAWLRVGLYINMMMFLVIVTNTYLLFCMSQKLLDLILNMLSLNFFLNTDNYAFKMMADYSQVTDVVKAVVKQQIEGMEALANAEDTKISTKMGLSFDYILFYLIVIYATVLPLVFVFYGAGEWEFGVACLGAGNNTC